MAHLSPLITENPASSDYTDDGMRGWRFEGLERVQLHNEDIRLVLQLGRTSVFVPHCHYEVLRE